MANTTDGILEYGMTDLGRLNSIVDYVDGDIMIVSNAASVSSSQPARGNMFTLMACAQGRLNISLNGESYVLKQGDLLFCLPNVIIGGVEVSDDFKGSVLCMTSRIVQGLLGTNVSTWNRALYVEHRIIFHLSDADVAVVVNYGDLLQQKMEEQNNPFKAEIIQSILRAILFELCSMMISNSEDDENDKSTNLNQAEIIFNRFIDILSAEKQKKHPVYYYASQLCISPKYLSVVCKQMSDRTASSWIEEYLNEDIRFHLRNTTKPIKEICKILNFPNLSFFGKYVKGQFGCTPTEYRKQK